MGIEKQAFLMNLKSQRKAMTPAQRQKPLRIPLWQYPWSQEKAYARKLSSLFKKLTSYVEGLIIQSSAAMLRGDSLHLDVQPGNIWKVLMATASGWIAENLPEDSKGQIYMGLGEVADIVNVFNSQQWKAQTKSVLISAKIIST